MSKKVSSVLSVVVAGALMTGCATQPEKIHASYVSPMEYTDYSCTQLQMEMKSVNRKAEALYKDLKQTANDDSAQMAVAIVLFWPALFFLEGGDGPEAAEYAELKGRKDALESAAIQKECLVG